jgi:serine/threonine protein kinase
MHRGRYNLSTMAVSVGDRIGPYQITGDVGSGGMGDVKKALDTRLNRVVAIKLLKILQTDRFEREARAIAALRGCHKINGTF